LKDRTILFLCTGNYYRSRFAEALFNHHAMAHKLPWRAISRGLAIDRVTERDDLSCFTLAALTERNIDCQNTSPKRNALTSGDLADADLVIALCGIEHRPMLEQAHPLWVDHIVYWGVHDLPHWSPNRALPEIEKQVLWLLETLADPVLDGAP
jgi:protein-tyrosine phosphatase